MSALGSVIPPLVAPLTTQQEQTMDLICGTSKINGLKRGVEFFYDLDSRTQKGIVVNIGKISIIGAAAAAATGALIGAGVGTVLKPGLGSAAGAYTGAVIGGAIGLTVTPLAITIRMGYVGRYVTWKNRAIQDRVYYLFGREVLETDLFKGLICPITGELPVVPVIAPCKHVFEKGAIEEWLKTKPHQAAACPSRCHKNFKIKHLVYHQERLNEIAIAGKQKIRELIEQREKYLKSEEESKKLSEGLSEEELKKLSENSNVTTIDFIKNSKIVEDAIKNTLEIAHDMSFDTFKVLVDSELFEAVKEKSSKEDVAKSVSALYEKYMSAHI